MSFVERPSAWLVRALGLRPGAAPSEMAETLTPTADALQGGCGLGTYSWVRFDQTNWTGTTHTLIAADINLVRLFQCNFGRVGGAAPNVSSMRLCTRPDPYSIAAQLRLFDLAAGAVATAAEFSWASLAQGALWWMLPPTSRLDLILPAPDGATDRVVMNLNVLTVPVGSKPW